MGVFPTTIVKKKKKEKRKYDVLYLVFCYISVTHSKHPD